MPIPSLASFFFRFREIENEDSQLELWGRHDGVPMRLGKRGDFYSMAYVNYGIHDIPSGNLT